MAYFERLEDSVFRPTEQVSGAWNSRDQHIAPALGLLAHLVETDQDRRRGNGLRISRLSYDILGTVSIEPFEVAVTVLRPGRSIELVEAVLTHHDRPAVLLRAWLMQYRDTDALAGSDLPRIPAPHLMEPWNPSTLWPGGFIASAEVRRTRQHPGRACYWVRTDVPLLEEPVSPTARAAGLLDIANGMAVRADPRDVAFPNIDLTAHLFREPAGNWLGFDTTVSFGPTGQGLTNSVVHDTEGPVGTVSQALSLRRAHD